MTYKPNTEFGEGVASFGSEASGGGGTLPGTHTGASPLSGAKDVGCLECGKPKVLGWDYRSVLRRHGWKGRFGDYCSLNCAEASCR